MISDYKIEVTETTNIHNHHSGQEAGVHYGPPILPKAMFTITDGIGGLLMLSDCAPKWYYFCCSHSITLPSFSLKELKVGVCRYAILLKRR